MYGQSVVMKNKPTFNYFSYYYAVMTIRLYILLPRSS